MFKNYMVLNGKKYFRGVYKTFKNAVRYGKQDFNNVDNILFLESIQNGTEKKKIDMFTLDEAGTKVYTFSYSYL